MTTLAVLAYLITMAWENPADGKFYHSRFNVGTNLKNADQLFDELVCRTIPLDTDHAPADAWMQLVAVTSWDRGDDNGPVTVILSKHEWQRVPG